MNRKQNSLMRFSRTERLAQLSEQEIVIEKKKREIQAKLEAQKKKETEEAFKKLEFSKETNNTKPGFSKKSWSGSEFKKNSSHEKPAEKLKESLANAFSNDGTFLDQFKKLSQSRLPSKESDTKNLSDSNEGNLSIRERNRKRENENDRDNPQSLKKNKNAPRDNNQSFLIKNSLNSGVHLQASEAFQYPQHEGVSVLSDADNSKPIASLLPIQISQTQSAGQHPEFHSNNVASNSNQSICSSTVQLMAPVQLPALHQSCDSKKFSANEPSGNPFSLTLTQPPVASQNNPGPSSVLSSAVQASEVPKVRSESISMTLKINSVKKLEAIPNPLDIDQALSPDSLKKNHFSFSEKESSKSTFLNASPNCRSTPIIENVSSHEKESSRISSAFCNIDDDDDDNDDDDDDDDDDDNDDDNDKDDKDDKDEDDEDEYENKDDSQLNSKLQHWADLVARCGDEFEDSLRSRNENDSDLRFLSNKNSKEYLSYRRLVLKYRMRLKSSTEGPSEKTRKLNFPKTYSEESRESIFPNNKELSKIKTSNEDGYIMKGYLGSEKTFSDIQQETKKIPEIHENQICNDECKSVLESTFKDQCLSNAQKQSLSKGNNIEVKTEERRKRKRKSRWGDAEPTTSVPGIETNVDLQSPGKLPAPKSTLLSQLTRSDPGLIQYARQTFGSTNLSEEDWKKAEDHYKINLLYQDMIKKRAEVEKLERQGKFKYEYDSDEDTEGGTWEHKLRQQEMQATQLWAEELTRQAAGKHHIGDFLPPEELERFMEKYNAVKEGREPDLSDYKEYKLKEDNVGYRLLQKMGWNEGQGLGQDGSGITNPVNKGATRHENQGLGIERPDGLEPGDDEYDAYRKRMMLAYRFRPNPLNNPRRPYY